MKGFLLDTHVVLWWLDDPQQLSKAAREVIEDSTNVIYLSAAAVWEMSIKKALGHLHIPNDLAEVLLRNGIRDLPITLLHGLAVADLPRHHNDPFDRMMITQAHTENLVLVTRDAALFQYDVALLRA